MVKSSNPVGQGFRMVLRDPVILLTEIGWRWSFGALATLILLLSSLSVLGSIHVNQTDRAAWRSNNPTLMAQALAGVLTESGFSVLRQAVWVLPAISLLWCVFGAAGRAATLTRLSNSDVSFRGTLVLHCSRALVMWIAGAAVVGALFMSARISMRGAEPDLLLYYALAFWSAVLIGGLWATANWYLSVAGLCCLQSGDGFLKSTGQAVRLARRQGGELGGISLIFGVVRLAVLAIAFVLCVLPSSLMATAPREYTAWVIAVSLVYFAVADFLYVSRMAAYLIVAASAETSQAGEAGISWRAEQAARF
jgi:hypothetical protein